MPKFNRTAFYFGTEQRMQGLPLPLSGADMSSEAWSESGTLMNGGGYGIHSWGSHKNYQFEWASTSSRQVAQIMKSYRDGSFGRGLIYFHDPLSYDINLLPARWADPSIAVREEGMNLVYDQYPTAQVTTGWVQHALPVQSAVYPAAGMPTGFVAETSLFIPIPPGYTLALGAMYTSASTASGVYVTPVDANGNNGTATRLTPLPDASTFLVNNFVHGGRGVRLWVGKTSAGATGQVVLSGMVARLVKSDLDDNQFASGFGVTPDTTGAFGGITKVSGLLGPWYGGQGHSGCRFDGVPTYVNYTGVNGGQVGFAASFKEVGGF